MQGTNSARKNKLQAVARVVLSILQVFLHFTVASSCEGVQRVLA